MDPTVYTLPLCEGCGKPLDVRPSSTGQHRRYHGNACRVRAFRLRHRFDPETSLGVDKAHEFTHDGLNFVRPDRTLGSINQPLRPNFDQTAGADDGAGATSGSAELLSNDDTSEIETLGSADGDASDDAYLFPSGGAYTRSLFEHLRLLEAAGERFSVVVVPRRDLPRTHRTGWTV
jgi:hypothetical protein